jgi:hypothetical protein
MIIDYGVPLSDTEKLAVDLKSYRKYFSDSQYNEEDSDDTIYIIDFDKLSFNDWYGSQEHQRYVNIFMRKKKLEKINKKADF